MSELQPDDGKLGAPSAVIHSKDMTVTDIERRIADWTLTPMENGEPFRVSRYRPGEEYPARRDFIRDLSSEREYLIRKCSRWSADWVMKQPQDND